MHGSFDRFQTNRNRAGRDWTVALLMLPALVAGMLVALAIFQPAASRWISEAAQAEFVGMNVPEIVPPQPAMQIRTVKAD